VKPTTRNSIASFLSAAGSLLSALASEFDSTEPADNTPAPAPTPKPRAKKETGTPAAADPSPAASEAATTAASKQVDPAAPEPAEETSAGGKTYEELRALIEPFVKDGKGPEVKKIIAKYGTDLKSMEAKHHAAFEKDISALGY
jgi:hypothetical protein